MDDHPGGAEVMLDVGGQDADEFFEDIGHSKEAREELKKLYIGEFKLDDAGQGKNGSCCGSQKKAAAEANVMTSTVTTMIVLIAILAILYGYYQSINE